MPIVEITFNQNSDSVVRVILPFAEIKLTVFVPHNASTRSLVIPPATVVNPIIIKPLTFAILHAIAKAADKIIQQ